MEKIHRMQQTPEGQAQMLNVSSAKQPVCERVLSPDDDVHQRLRG